MPDPWKLAAGDAAAIMQALLLDVTALPRAADQDGVADALKLAIAMAISLRETAVRDPALLQRIDEAAAAIAALEERIAATDINQATASARKRLHNAHGLLHACREPTMDVIVAAQSLPPRARPATRPQRRTDEPGKARETPEGAFSASVGVPACHTLHRPMLSPHVHIERKRDVLDDSPVPAQSVPSRAPMHEHLRMMARDALSDMVTCSALRQPLPHQGWLTPAKFERRFLDVFDALGSLGASKPLQEEHGYNLLEEVQRWARQSAIPDPGRAFVQAFVLGSVSGEDAMVAETLAMRQAQELLLPHHARALALASGPHVNEAMVAMLREGSPAQVAAALAVLRFRRHVPLAELVPLTAHPETLVAVAAAEALGVANDRAGAREVLLHIVTASADEDGERHAAAVESLARLGDDAALRWCRELLHADIEACRHTDAARERLLRVLAHTGVFDDVELLVQVLDVSAHDALAVGWFGHVALVDWLIEALRGSNEVREMTGPWARPFELAVGAALFRITGAKVEDDPSLQHIERPDGDHGLAIDAGAWRTYWNEARGSFDIQKKYRFGEPFTPSATVNELCDANSRIEDRTWAEREASFLTPGNIGLETLDWLPKQQRALNALVKTHESLRYTAGRWPRILKDT